MGKDGCIRLIYIMGTARSGSTILEILLAHGEGAFGAGELTALVQDGLIQNKPCSCGQPFRECEVWGKVCSELNLTPDEYDDWARLQNRLDWHDGFFRQWLGLVRSSDQRRYKQYNLNLLKAIQKVTGAKVIVDSSKYAGRALALSGMEGIDLRVICLTRSPDGLMASFQKPNQNEQRPKSPLSTLVYYGVVLILLRLAVMLLGRQQVYPLYYEEVMDDPQNVLQDLGKWCDLDIALSLHRLQQHKFFDVGHLVTANRLRRKGRIIFSPKKAEACAAGLSARFAVMSMNIWRRLWL